MIPQYVDVEKWVNPQKNNFSRIGNDNVTIFTVQHRIILDLYKETSNTKWLLKSCKSLCCPCQLNKTLKKLNELE